MAMTLEVAMSSDLNEALVLGLPTAAASAALYGLAPLVQAMAARRERAGRGLGLGLLARLALRPLWLLGLAVEVLSFLVEVYALSVAPMALVTPVMAADMVVFVLLARWLLGERITRVGVAGIVAMMCGLVLLACAFEQDAEVGTAATGAEMAAFFVLGLVFVLGCGYIADRAARDGKVVAAALGLGLAAGVSYTVSVVATRQLGLFVGERSPGGMGVLGLFATPTPYMLVVFSVLALGLVQRGLQGRAAVVAYPVTSGVSAFLPVVLGLSVFGEPVPEGSRFVLLVCSLALVAGGIVGLGRDRASAMRSMEGIGAAVVPAGGCAPQEVVGRAPTGAAGPVVDGKLDHPTLGADR